MIVFLRVLFTVILGSMLWVTSWASLQCPLFGVPPAVATHPWFVATLFDAYWGFVTFLVWACYRQASWTAKIAWVLAVLSLGNIAMSCYCLASLYRVPRGGKLSSILTERQEGPGWLGIFLAGAGIAVTLAAAVSSHATR